MFTHFAQNLGGSYTHLHLGIFSHCDPLKLRWAEEKRTDFLTADLQLHGYIYFQVLPLLQTSSNGQLMKVFFTSPPVFFSADLLVFSHRSNTET